MNTFSRKQTSILIKIGKNLLAGDLFTNNKVFPSSDGDGPGIFDPRYAVRPNDRYKIDNKIAHKAIIIRKIKVIFKAHTYILILLIVDTALIIIFYSFSLNR